jgi:hypothetical protein
VLLRTIRLLGKKVTITVSGLSGSGEADACDVDRSFCGDIWMGPSLALGMSERSCGVEPCLGSVAGNRLIEETTGAALPLEPR